MEESKKSERIQQGKEKSKSVCTVRAGRYVQDSIEWVWEATMMFGRPLTQTLSPGVKPPTHAALV